MKNFFPKMFILLFATACISSCYKDDQLINENNSVIGFKEGQRTALIADGVTLLPVTIQLKQTSDRNNRTMGIAVTNAKLRDGSASGTIAANDSNEAVIFVSSTGIGTAVITATIGSFQDKLTIQLLPAKPNRIFVTESSDYISSSLSSSSTITAALQRDTGQCSAMLPVLYDAFDSVGVRHGAFFNVQPSDASANSKALFRVNDAFRGTLHIRASYVVAPGDTVRGENLLFIHN